MKVYRKTRIIVKYKNNKSTKETLLLSEKVLTIDWNKIEEDKAWESFTAVHNNEK